MQIILTGQDSEQALAELTSNVQYDNLDCKIKVDRDSYKIDPRTPTHASDEQIAEMRDLFRQNLGQMEEGNFWQFPDVDSDYNYANTPESFAVTFHNLTAEQVTRLAALLS